MLQLQGADLVHVALRLGLRLTGCYQVVRLTDGVETPRLDIQFDFDCMFHKMAETAGFEPAIPFRVYLLSR